LVAYISAWNTVVYFPTLKLSFPLLPYPYSMVSIPLFILELSVNQTTPQSPSSWNLPSHSLLRKSYHEGLITYMSRYYYVSPSCRMALHSVRHVGMPYPLDLDCHCLLQQSLQISAWASVSNFRCGGGSLRRT
jgi:hypothetical protein